VRLLPRDPPAAAGRRTRLSRIRLSGNRHRGSASAIRDRWRTCFGLQTAAELAEKAGRIADAKSYYARAVEFVDAVGDKEETRELFAKLDRLNRDSRLAP